MDSLVTADGNWDDKWDSNLVNASYLHTFSSDSIFEFKFGANWGSWARYPSHRNHDNPGSGTWSTARTPATGGPYQPDHKITLRGTFTQRVENLAGSHDFKVGLEAERSGGYWDMTIPGGMYFLTLNNQPYMGVTTHGYQGFTNWLFSGYIQDDWRISDSLVINPGLRYNVARGKVPGHRRRPSGSPTWASSPGLGLVWDITGNQTTVLKAHIGKYYDGTRSYNFWSLTPQGDTDILPLELRDLHL